MWNAFLQILGLKKAAYSPGSGVWGPANTSAGVYPVPYTGEKGEEQQSSGLEWFSGGRVYPTVDRDREEAELVHPYSFRKMGPELIISHRESEYYW